MESRKSANQRPKYHIKDIFAQHWERFCVTLKHRIPNDMWDSVEEAVKKMLSCGDPKNGFAKYLCFDCLHL